MANVADIATDAAGSAAAAATTAAQAAATAAGYAAQAAAPTAAQLAVVDANPASGFRVQQDARQKASLASVTAKAPEATGTASVDTAALQAAINALPEYGTLLISGHYKVNAAITVGKAMTIRGINQGDTFKGITAGGDSSTPSSPGVDGTVIEQTAAATDGLAIISSGKAVNLFGFSILFATGIAGNTGHGVNADPTATYSGHDDLGVMSYTWENISVFGHDGNHYGFRRINSLLGNTKGLRAFGGGGFYTECNHTAINCGNDVNVHPYVALNNAGTAGGYVHKSRTSSGNGGLLNLITYVRPQCMVGGAAETAATQYLWDDLSGTGIPKHIHVVGADLESTGNPARFGEGTQFIGTPYITGGSRSETITSYGEATIAANPSAGELTAFGYEALHDATTGGSNTGIGAYALTDVSTGPANVAVGADAARQVTTGEGNVAVGYQAGHAPRGDSSKGSMAAFFNVFIGRQAGATGATVNSAVAIGNGSVADNNAVAIANGSKAGFRSVALGDDVEVTGSRGAGLGYGSGHSENDTIKLGTADATSRTRVGRLNVFRLTPSGSADSQGTTGDVATDDSYVYVKTSGGWKRAALSTF